ncbi:MAG TPA: hypothetical protein VFC33_17765 [Acidimicrobiia bacterium]|nr:hypothetical protein [Acidimicrobiia bacterium]
MKPLRSLLVTLSAVVVVALGSTPAWADTVAAAKPKPWHFWIAPILALGAFLIVIALLVGYYVRVLGPKYRGR